MKTLHEQLHDCITEKTYSQVDNEFLTGHQVVCAITLNDGKTVRGIGTTKEFAEQKALSLASVYALQHEMIVEEPIMFSFSVALRALKNGKKVMRKGWNGKDQWLSVSNLITNEVEADNFWSKHNADFARSNGGSALVAPCITLKNAQNQIVMGWVPSAGDLFADDWMIAE